MRKVLTKKRTRREERKNLDKGKRVGGGVEENPGEGKERLEEFLLRKEGGGGERRRVITD